VNVCDLHPVDRMRLADLAFALKGMDAESHRTANILVGVLMRRLRGSDANLVDNIPALRAIARECQPDEFMQRALAAIVEGEASPDNRPGLPFEGDSVSPKTKSEMRGREPLKRSISQDRQLVRPDCGCSSEAHGNSKRA
jgi:hypothetical protein